VTRYHTPEESILSYTVKKTFKLNEKERIVKKLHIRELVNQTSEDESDRDVNLFPFLRQFCVLNKKKICNGSNMAVERMTIVFLDFKFSPCSEPCICSFGSAKLNLTPWRHPKEHIQDNCLALRRPKFQVLSQKRIFRLIPFVIIHSLQTKA
jgi:hypothetical protein